jgi:excisionase family DNA binding protein
MRFWTGKPTSSLLGRDDQMKTWRIGRSVNGRVTGMMRRKFLTVDELSEYLHVHKTTIYRMLKQGKLPGFRVGTDWRFDVDVVEQWVRDQKNKPH